MKVIRSVSNPLFKDLEKLAGSSRARREARRTILDGIHLLDSYLNAGFKPRLFVCDLAQQEHPEVLALLARAPEVERIGLSPNLYERLTELVSPGPVLGLIDIPEPVAAIEEERFVLLLETIQDPGNLGSIIRSALAAGVETVYLSHGCAEAWSPKALRGGMGAHFKIKMIEQSNLTEISARFPGQIMAASLRGDANLYDVDQRGRCGWIIGNEGAGISEPLLAQADRLVRIPMAEGTESLNAAAAAAVCLFERVRQVLQRAAHTPG